MNKKIITTVLLFILIFTLGCGAKKESKVLYIYNWDYYIPEEILTEFEKNFNVKIEYITFSSNEEMYENILKNSNFDIVFPSGDIIPMMIKKDLLEKVDRTKIPNFRHINSDILKKINFDTGNKYTVPYMIGAAGIAVNTKYVKNYPKDYSIFEMNEYQGKFTMLDDMREVIGAALSSFGYSVNSINEVELEEATKKLEKWDNNIAKYDSTTFGIEFSEEKYWIAQCYAENIFLELSNDMSEDVDFFIPKNGGTMYLDNMAILKLSNNKELAYKFINFIHEPQNYAKICDYLLVPSINDRANDFLKEEPLYTIDELNNCEFINYLGDDLKKYEKIWDSISKQEQD